MTGSEAVRDVSLPANLHRLAVLTRGWDGVPLDPGGTVRLIHPNAAQLPIFWCFNSQQEFPALGAALGAGQPLVGMRSLNQVMAGGPLRPFSDRELAGYYAETLLHHFGPVPCIIGGNCQAAPVAHGIARCWMAAGGTVARLVTLDATLRRPYAGAIRLLFGARSEKHNPFLTQPDPESAWRFLYAAHDVGFLPAGHGEYFGAAVVDHLAAAILAPSRSGPPRQPPQTARDLSWNVAGPTKAVAGGRIELVAAAPQILAPDQRLAMLPLWSSPERGVWLADPDQYLAAIGHAPERGVFICQVKAPDQPGHWALDPVTCTEGWGPCTGPDQDRSLLEMEII